MNNEIKQKAEALNQWILSQELIQEYKKLALEMEQHPEFKKQEEQLKKIQKQIIQTKDQGKDSSHIEHEYQQQKESFLSHPLINNYLVLKQEVNELLLQINTIINQHIQE